MWKQANLGIPPLALELLAVEALLAELLWWLWLLCLIVLLVILGFFRLYPDLERVMLPVDFLDGRLKFDTFSINHRLTIVLSYMYKDDVQSWKDKNYVVSFYWSWYLMMIKIKLKPDSEPDLIILSITDKKT